MAIYGRFQEYFEFKMMIFYIENWILAISQIWRTVMKNTFYLQLIAKILKLINN